jgi:hypothetical protein
MKKFRPYEQKTGEELVNMLEEELSIKINGFKLAGFCAILGAMFYIMPVGFYILAFLLVALGAGLMFQLLIMGTIFRKYEKTNLLVEELRTRTETTTHRKKTVTIIEKNHKKGKKR